MRKYFFAVILSCVALSSYGQGKDCCIPFCGSRLAIVELDGKYGFIDRSGREITPVKYDDASRFSEGLAVVELDGKYGFIDRSGREITPIKYDDTGSFN